MKCKLNVFLVFLMIVSGPSNASIEFDEVDDDVQVSDDATLEQSTATIACWVNVSSSQSDLGFIITKWDQSTDNQSWEIAIDVRGTKPDVRAFIDENGVASDGYTDVEGNANTSFPTDSLEHITLQWNGTKARVFHNASQAGSDTTVGSPFDSTAQMQIGGRPDDNNSLNGKVYSCRYWSSELSTTQLGHHYNQGVPCFNCPVDPSNLEAHYILDSGSPGTSADGDTILDLSLNNNTGTGDDGGNDSGLTWKSDSFGTYSGR